METPEEFVGSNDRINLVSVKGRGNKRMRLVCGGADATSSSSCGGGGSGGDNQLTASSSVSDEIIISTEEEEEEEEEEDMANCLILLAQGDAHRRPTQFLQQADLKIDNFSSKRFNFEMSKTGFNYIYECKTCNRSFPSFQALGGHRASHKKPKPIAAGPFQEPEEAQFNTFGPVNKIPIKPAATPNFQTHKSRKIHECSICGLEFSSGQALGGHMRRHRATAVSSPLVVAEHNHNHNHNHSHNHNNSSTSAMEITILKHRNNILELDLNLPAPEEDLRETKFQFTATPQTIVFSAPTLVDCHY